MKRTHDWRWGWGKANRISSVARQLPPRCLRDKSCLRFKRSLLCRDGMQRLWPQLEVYLHFVRLPLQDHLRHRLVSVDRGPSYSLWGWCHPGVWGRSQLRSAAAHLLPDSPLASGPFPGRQLCSLEPQGAGAPGLLQWWWGGGLLEVPAAWRPVNHLDLGQKHGSQKNVIKTFLAPEWTWASLGWPLTWFSSIDLGRHAEPQNFSLFPPFWCGALGKDPQNISTL